MENCRIFKLEKVNAIIYHEADQKSWFLLTERYMFSSLQCWWGYLKKCCETRGYLNKIEKIAMARWILSYFLVYGLFYLESNVGGRKTKFYFNNLFF